MAVGRIPKPRTLRLIEGNPSRKPLPDSPPEYNVSGDRVPTGLDDIAKKKWLEIAPQLIERGVLQDVDRDTLSTYCMWWSILSQLEHKRQVCGMRDFSELSAILIRLRDASIQLRSYAAELGITPACRARVVSSLSQTAQDEFESFIAEFEDAETAKVLKSSG